MRILLTVLLFSGLFSAPLSVAIATNLDRPLVNNEIIQEKIT